MIEVRSTLSETTVIDGFTITNGDGGISIALSSVAIQNCRIVHNHATANLAGGGIDIDHAFVTITNTLIVTNTADLWDGAIRITSATHITAPNSVVTIANSTIANNRASQMAPNAMGSFAVFPGVQLSIALSGVMMVRTLVAMAIKPLTQILRCAFLAKEISVRTHTSLTRPMGTTIFNQTRRA